MGCRLAVSLACLVGATGCGGAAPLFHAAHPLPKDKMTFGAGFSGSFNVDPPPVENPDGTEETLLDAATAPGLAPWVGARLGFGHGLDGGLTYTARAIRVDGRYAYEFGEDNAFAVSVGAGFSALLNRLSGSDASFGGMGGDVPILVGYQSDADIYAFYLGGRVGAEALRGQEALPADEVFVVEARNGWHVQTGGLIGARVGFRHVFGVLEFAADYHWAGAEFEDDEVSVEIMSLRPAGGLLIKF
ncbi:MAG: hypothetical protein AAGA56_28860 [Myxococcota bacterium]